MIVASASSSNAAISITDFTLSYDSIEFRIHGEFPLEVPHSYVNSIYFVNPTLDESPGFALSDFLGADSISFSGSQSIIVKVGGSAFGDYFFVNFIDNFVANQPIDETIVATWNSAVFDPDAVEEIDVRWGVSSVFEVGDGTYLTTIAVPEPSVGFISGMLFLGYLAKRRRPR